ncbi:AEC family transporter [Microlunatus elymi]|uniref:AEC family transporter n=1 Tax=Microlunatus elymi TaxID=2596828 RepID=A0A516Q137_9ACTN|nr:AEC family transporter [Microlunatus elymi]QDP97149.1 AEC family transporter [Microlunatus elymi]
MGGVLQGFLTIVIVIGVGFLIAHLKIAGANAQTVLARLAFFVASPALMVTVLSETDVRQIFSTNLIASISCVAVSATLYVLAARLIFRRSAPDTVIGTFCSAYVNAGNLGLPMAAYVLGSASWIVPMLLTQMILLQPLGLAILDLTTNAQATGRARWLRLISQPFRNPLMIGSLVGLLLSIFSVQLPRWVNDPLHMIGDMAVPAMLIAYGISLRLGPLPGRGEPKVQIGYIVLLKLIVQPLVGYLMAEFVLGLPAEAVLAVTVVAALPTAQNVFTHAVRYDRGVILARDSIFVTTVLSLPVLVGIAALLSP